MSDTEANHPRKNDLLAAVDLGSNSFHLVIARCMNDRPQVIDRSRESVQLAAGVDADGRLAAAYRVRALTALTKFAQRMQTLVPRHVLAVATHAVRSLRDGGVFLRAAEQTLGHPIKIVSGQREAELIWSGVAHSQPAATSRQLLIDIGGGSTEVIVGKGMQALFLQSIPVGCVGISVRHFADGRLDAERWQCAQLDLHAALQPFARKVRDVGWERACATSGTASAIAGVGQALGLDNGISATTLSTLREHMLQRGHMSRIDLPGLRTDRRGVIAGGVAVMQAVFEVFGVRHVQANPQSLRDGLLWEILNKLPCPTSETGQR